MYGLVNKALRDMVVSQHGEAVWEDICQQAGAEVSLFVSSDPYADELTYRLVSVSSERLQCSAAEVLQRFGQHWVLHTAGEGYGQLMQGAGRTLPEFLRNLNNLHARVGLLYPHLQPPRFECTDEEDTALVLQHFTHRAGLAPFIVGLIHGLAQRFGLTVRVQQVSDRSQGADHDAFAIRWSAPA